MARTKRRRRSNNLVLQPVRMTTLNKYDHGRYYGEGSSDALSLSNYPTMQGIAEMLTISNLRTANSKDGRDAISYNSSNGSYRRTRQTGANDTIGPATGGRGNRGYKRNGSAIRFVKTPRLPKRHLANNARDSRNVTGTKELQPTFDQPFTARAKCCDGNRNTRRLS